MKQMVATEQIEGIKSDQQTIDLINQAIEDGEIEVGGDLYVHKLKMALQNSGVFYYGEITIINNSEDKINTKGLLAKFLHDKSFNSMSNEYILLDFVPQEATASDNVLTHYIIYSLYSSNGTTLSARVKSTTETYTIEDSAIKIAYANYSPTNVASVGTITITDTLYKI